MNRGTLAVATLLVLRLVINAIARIDYKMIPRLGDAQNAWRTPVAYLVLLVATVVIWLNGTVLHPQSPRST